ncbi:hypothetical protein MBLNU230_g2653t1 [Neophaeotheca triangularis]
MADPRSPTPNHRHHLHRRHGPWESHTSYSLQTTASQQTSATAAPQPKPAPKTNGIHLSPSDVASVQEADYTLAIVPPRDAVAVAKRIAIAANTTCTSTSTSTSNPHRWQSQKEPRHYLNQNAISPQTSHDIATLLSQ